ncbi:DUF7507 domain-containing protein [Frondihabitans cladoniiphilus]|uniref:Repeat protein (TIGR01451 family) n=1 Tax=Frondihabitans cladoniiphilus TaxID=715785 RepID=A0ABP8VXH4_9MICO
MPQRHRSLLAPRRRRLSQVGVALGLGVVAATAAIEGPGVEAVEAAATPARASHVSPVVSGTAGAVAKAAAPRTLFREDFESGTGASATVLGDYAGASGERYTADPAWLDPANCDGIITSFSGSDHASCPGAHGSAIRDYAHVLGQVAQAGPDANHSVSAYTRYSVSGRDLVEFETSAPIRLSAAKRFVTFSVDAVASACHRAQPELDFFLVDGSSEIPTAVDPVNPCVDEAASDYVVSGSDLAFRAGSYASSGAVLFSGDELGIRMRNRTAEGQGNDHSYDNVTVLDATPRLDVSFATGRHVVGDVVPMTFTVTNTTEKGAKPGWAFDESLPSGLRVATAGTTTCSAGSVFAADRSIHGTGDLGTGEASCTVTVGVTAERAGSFRVDAAAATDLTGLDAPRSATVSFDAAAPSLSVSETATVTNLTRAGRPPEVGDRIVFEASIENTGNVALFDVSATSAVGGVLRPVSRTLEVGASTTATGEPHVVEQADVDAGRVADAVTVTASAPESQRLSGADSRTGVGAGRQVVTGTASVEVATVAEDASLSIVESASIDGVAPAADADTGDRIDVQAVVANTGNVTITDMVVTSGSVGGLSCEVTVLAPNDSVGCSGGAPIVVTQDDVDSGAGVMDEASVAGTSAQGSAIVAGPSRVVVPVTAARPGLDLSATSSHGDDDHDGGLDLDEAISFGYTAMNTGNLVVQLGGVESSLNGTLACGVAELLPGEKTACGGGVRHVVSRGDIERGEIVDASRGTGFVSRGAGGGAGAGGGNASVATSLVDRRVPVSSSTFTLRFVPDAISAPTPLWPVLAFTGSVGLPLLGGVAVALLAGGGLLLLVRRYRAAR